MDQSAERRAFSPLLGLALGLAAAAIWLVISIFFGTSSATAADAAEHEPGPPASALLDALPQTADRLQATVDSVIEQALNAAKPLPVFEAAEPVVTEALDAVHDAVDATVDNAVTVVEPVAEVVDFMLPVTPQLPVVPDLVPAGDADHLAPTEPLAVASTLQLPIPASPAEVTTAQVDTTPTSPWQPTHPAPAVPVPLATTAGNSGGSPSPPAFAAVVDGHGSHVLAVSESSPDDTSLPASVTYDSDSSPD